MNKPTIAKSRRLRSTIFTSRIEEQGLTKYTVYNKMLLPAQFSDTLEDSYYHLKDIQSRTALMLANDIKCAKCKGKTQHVIKILTDYKTRQLRRSLFGVFPAIYNDIIDIIVKFVNLLIIKLDEM